MYRCEQESSHSVTYTVQDSLAGNVERFQVAMIIFKALSKESVADATSSCIAVAHSAYAVTT